MYLKKYFYICINYIIIIIKYKWWFNNNMTFLIKKSLSPSFDWNNLYLIKKFNFNFILINIILSFFEFNIIIKSTHITSRYDYNNILFYYSYYIINFQKERIFSFNCNRKINLFIFINNNWKILNYI